VNDLAEPMERTSTGSSRSLVERAVLVPAGAVLLAAEEIIGVAAALTDAERAGRELLHFEERGARARTHVERLLHDQRGRVADQLDQRIEQARHHLTVLAARSKGISSKIRPEVPTNT